MMAGDPKNKIEFRFYGAGGSGEGPRGTLLFALLCGVAMIVIIVLAIKLGAVVFAVPWVARIRGP